MVFFLRLRRRQIVAVPCSAKAESPQTDGALFAGIPNPPNGKSLGAGAISNGGKRASFTTSVGHDPKLSSPEAIA
jgi:hypothetical protein